MCCCIHIAKAFLRLMSLERERKCIIHDSQVAKRTGPKKETVIVKDTVKNDMKGDARSELSKFKEAS